MRIYVGQFDAFWSLSCEQWVDLCRRCAAGEQYDISRYKRLKRKPKCIHRVRDDWCNGYMNDREDVIYVEPLDWYDVDFEEHLNDVLNLEL